MTRTLIIVLALVALALGGCGDKGEVEAPKSKEKAPSPVKAPNPEPAPAPASGPETPPAVEEEPMAKSPEPEPGPTPVESGRDAPPTAEPAPEPEDSGLKPLPQDVLEAEPTPVESGRDAPPTAELPMADLSPLDLSTVDSTVKVILMAPAGAAARDDYGSIEIAKEPDFQMEFSEEEAVDFLARKKEIEGNGINKLKKYHVDTADTLIYETEIMGKPEFHFIATVTVGDLLYLCEDQRGPVFSQAAVATMLAACRSARLKEHSLPMPALDGAPGGPAMPPIDLD